MIARYSIQGEIVVTTIFEFDVATFPRGKTNEASERKATLRREKTTVIGLAHKAWQIR
jgi:hypothetical protein